MAQGGLHRTGRHAQSIRFRIGACRIRRCHPRCNRICEPNLAAGRGEGPRHSQVISATIMLSLDALSGRNGCPNYPPVAPPLPPHGKQNPRPFHSNPLIVSVFGVSSSVAVLRIKPIRNNPQRPAPLSLHIHPINAAPPASASGRRDGFQRRRTNSENWRLAKRIPPP